MTYFEFLAYLFDSPETREIAYVLAEAHAHLESKTRQRNGPLIARRASAVRSGSRDLDHAAT